MENITAKVSCFARANHYKNSESPIFEDTAAKALLGEDYDRIAEALEGFNCADIAAFVEKVKEAPIRRGLASGTTEEYITADDVEAALAASHSSVQQSDLEAFSKWEASQR